MVMTLERAYPPMRSASLLAPPVPLMKDLTHAAAKHRLLIAFFINPSWRRAAASTPHAFCWRLVSASPRAPRRRGFSPARSSSPEAKPRTPACSTLISRRRCDAGRWRGASGSLTTHRSICRSHAMCGRVSSSSAISILAATWMNLLGACSMSDETPRREGLLASDQSDSNTGILRRTGPSGGSCNSAPGSAQTPLPFRAESSPGGWRNAPGSLSRECRASP